MTTSMAEIDPALVARAQEAGVDPEVLQAALQRELMIRRQASIARAPSARPSATPRRASPPRCAITR